MLLQKDVVNLHLLVESAASLVSFTKLKSVYYRGMTKWMSHNGLSVYDAKAKIRECHRKSLSGEPVSCNTTSMFLTVTADEMASGNPMPDAIRHRGDAYKKTNVQAVNTPKRSGKTIVLNSLNSLNSKVLTKQKLLPLQAIIDIVLNLRF